METKKKKKRLTISAVTAIRKNSPLDAKKENVKNIEKVTEDNSKKVRLKDLERFSKSVRFPVLWKDEIESNIDYPTDLSSFIVEAIKEKMEQENMNTFLG